MGKGKDACAVVRLSKVTFKPYLIFQTSLLTLTQGLNYKQLPKSFKSGFWFSGF
jgi:hypothetical protein